MNTIPFLTFPVSKPDFSWNPHITLLTALADELGLHHTTSEPYETLGGLMVPNFMWICLPERPDVSPFEYCLKYDVNKGQYTTRTVLVYSSYNQIRLSSFATTRKTAVDGAVGTDNSSWFNIEDLDRDRLHRCLTDMLDTMERMQVRSASSSIENSASLLDTLVHG